MPMIDWSCDWVDCDGRNNVALANIDQAVACLASTVDFHLDRQSRHCLDSNPTLKPTVASGGHVDQLSMAPIYTKGRQ